MSGPDRGVWWRSLRRVNERQEAQAPWHQQGYAYHHVLARAATPPG
jgi:hypothetical protein